MARTQNDTLLGIVFLVLGVLILLGFLPIPFLTEIVAVAAIVVGVLTLMGTFRAATWVAVVLIVLGILLLLSNPIGALLSNVVGTVLDVLIGLALIVLGILKLAGGGTAPRRATASHR